MRHVVWIGMALTVAVATAGCGSSHSTPQSSASMHTTSSERTPPTSRVPSVREASSTSARPQRVTRKQFVERADRICALLNARAGSIKVRTLQDVAGTAPELAGYYRAALAELHGLSPPAPLAGDWRAVVADIQTLVGRVVAMGKYAGDNDPRAAGKVSTEIGDLQRHRIAAAKHIGLEDCARV